MSRKYHKKINNIPVIPEEWKKKVLSVVPDTHISHFVSSGAKRIHIRTVDNTARMTLEWINGEHDALFINDLNVSKSHRNKSLGKELLDLAAAVARKTGRFTLAIYARFTDAQVKWLLKNGFIDTEILYSMDTLDGCTYDNDWNSQIDSKSCYIKHLLC